MLAAVTQSWSAPAVPASVPSIRGKVVAFASAASVVDPPLEDLRLAVSEALTNVVVHSYRDRVTPGAIQVTATAFEGALRVVVGDDGSGMAPRPDSPGMGMGLPLISAVSDTMEIRSRKPTGTELHMCFDY